MEQAEQIAAIQLFWNKYANLRFEEHIASHASGGSSGLKQKSRTHPIAAALLGDRFGLPSAHRAFRSRHRVLRYRLPDSGVTGIAPDAVYNYRFKSHQNQYGGALNAARFSLRIKDKKACPFSADCSRIKMILISVFRPWH